MTDKQSMTIGGISVDIIRKTNLKNMYIRVFPPDGTVTVSSSFEFKEDEIRLFVLNKLPEITKARNKMLSQLRQSKREYVSGESYYLWGKPYPLRVVYSGSRSKMEKMAGKLILTVPEGTDEAKREKIVTEWYRQEMKRILETQIPNCEKKAGISANEYKIRNMKTRWGTCNIGDGKITLNLQLAKKPPECLEYVLIHELVHLMEKNHTNRFYALVEEFCPNWKEAKKQLVAMPLDYIEKGEHNTDGEEVDMERYL